MRYCPSCGSTNLIEPESAGLGSCLLVLITGGLYLIPLLLRGLSNKWKCRNCGNEFRKPSTADPSKKL